eukprot:1504819-Pyramimonas_sp.AAC.1
MRRNPRPSSAFREGSRPKTGRRDVTCEQRPDQRNPLGVLEGRGDGPCSHFEMPSPHGLSPHPFGTLEAA